jgi:hypothetical protein
MASHSPSPASVPAASTPSGSQVQPSTASGGAHTNAPSSEDLRRAQEFTLDVLHSRYELYAWCEDKVNNLITVSGVLLGAVFLVITNDKIRDGWQTVDLILASIAAVLLGLGLTVSLVHIVPKMNSGVGNDSNLRVTYATDKLSKDEFYARVLAMTPEQALRSTTDQIKGMNRNIMRNQRAIRVASYSTIAGLIMLGAVIARTVL